MIIYDDNYQHLTITHAQWHILSWHIAKSLLLSPLITHSAKKKNVDFNLFQFLWPQFIIFCVSKGYIYDCPCLPNSCNLGQLVLFHLRCSPTILRWNLWDVSLRQQHCGTSVLPEHYIQAPPSPALVSGRDRGDENGHTILKRPNAQEKMLQRIIVILEKRQKKTVV